MELIKCDECEAEVEIGLRWFRVEIEGVAHYRGEPDEYHLCSEECIAKHFRVLADRRRAK